MSERTKAMMMLGALVGLMDGGYRETPTFAARDTSTPQTDEQRQAALARAEAKRARRRERNIATTEAPHE